jgi:hypothetical protein
MQRLRNLSRDECREPGDDRRENGGEGPEEQPDEVGDREQQPEEDGPSRALEVVVDDDPDGVLGELGERLREPRIGARKSRGEEQEVPSSLRPRNRGRTRSRRGGLSARVRTRDRRTTRGTRRPPPRLRNQCPRRPALLRAGARESRRAGGRSHPSGPGAQAGRSRGRPGSRGARGIRDTGSLRGTDTRRGESRNGGIRRRSCGASSEPLPR